MTRVAFVGTGKMGSAMVENLLRRGEQVTVWNRSADKARALEPLGATVVSSLAEVATGAARVHLVLLDDASVDAALAELVLAPDALVIDHTTTAPAATGVRAARLATRGVRFLHAPVFMGPPGAREGNGTMLVSGPQAVFDAAQPALAAMASDVTYLGERADLAAAMKLFGNSMLLLMSGAMADLFSLARATDVDPRQAFSALEKVKLDMLVKVRGGKMASGDYATMFALETARKDLRLMIETAGHEPLALLPALAATMDAAIADGHGAQDLAALVEVGRRK